MFGKRLKELREETNISAGKLGRVIGVDPLTIYRWERETDKLPNAKYVIDIAKYFYVTTDYLLGLKEE